MPTWFKVGNSKNDGDCEAEEEDDGFGIFPLEKAGTKAESGWTDMSLLKSPSLCSHFRPVYPLEK